MKKILIIILIASVFLVGCQSEPQIQVSGPIADRATVDGNINVKAVDLTAKKFEFFPEKIEVRKNDILVINVDNFDLDCNFVIDEYSLSIPLAPGRNELIEFVAHTEGAFDVKCIGNEAGYDDLKLELIVNNY